VPTAQPSNSEIVSPVASAITSREIFFVNESIAIDLALGFRLYAELLASILKQFIVVQLYI
jgi:hypothetical protein